MDSAPTAPSCLDLHGDQAALEQWRRPPRQISRMSTLDWMGFALGSGVAAGLNVYATVGALGLLHWFGLYELPPSLEVLAHPWVIATACTLYAVEFLADKIPYVDSVWDSVHTFVRPPAAAVLAYGAMGDVSEPARVAAGLLAGTFAFTAHGTKATARLAANASPEPFSNWVLSLGEDILALSLVGLVTQYPTVALLVACGITAVFAWILVKLSRVGRRLFGRHGDATPDPLAS